MQSISTINSVVHFGSKGYSALHKDILNKSYSGLFILVDENTSKHCLPVFLEKYPEELDFKTIEIPSGEIHKSLQSCEKIWNALSNQGADRKSLLINLGGGVITDMGGFVAACFKRGIDFVNIPTSLLSMVDASVGGKTGIDLGLLKNQIGIFKEGKMVLIDADFLSTLPDEHMTSGMAEILKHGLIADRAYWEEVSNPEIVNTADLPEVIRDSVIIKNKIVKEDQYETGVRKALNFGHTLGHAIESHFLNSSTPLLHGEAIAIGMVMEAYLSQKYCGLNPRTTDEIKTKFDGFFERVSLTESDRESIIQFLKFDKKNAYGKVLFVLLKSIGKPVFNKEVDRDALLEAFDYYQN